MNINLQKAEAALQTSYAAGAERYRQDDEIEVLTPHHRRLAAKLAEITSSFGHPISVLDAGCGTGRFFYCLRNVNRLVGMDISPEMLRAAERPVNAQQTTAREIQLMQANIFFANFQPQSFDFIYSLGMFGHGCPVTVEVCDKFHSWLTPGGQLFFDVVDFAGLPWASRVKRQARDLIYPALPIQFQVMLDGRHKDTPLFGLTKRELEKILHLTRFSRFKVSSRLCESPLWRGRHLECHATL